MRERPDTVYAIVKELADNISEIQSIAVVTFARSGEVHTHVSHQGPPLTAFAGLLLQQIAMRDAHQSVEDGAPGGDLAAE